MSLIKLNQSTVKGQQICHKIVCSSFTHLAFPLSHQGYSHRSPPPALRLLHQIHPPCSQCFLQHQPLAQCIAGSVELSTSRLDRAWRRGRWEILQLASHLQILRRVYLFYRRVFQNVKEVMLISQILKTCLISQLPTKDWSLVNQSGAKQSEQLVLAARFLCIAQWEHIQWDCEGAYTIPANQCIAMKKKGLKLEDEKMSTLAEAWESRDPEEAFHEREMMEMRRQCAKQKLSCHMSAGLWIEICICIC